MSLSQSELCLTSNKNIIADLTRFLNRAINGVNRNFAGCVKEDLTVKLPAPQQ